MISVNILPGSKVVGLPRNRCPSGLQLVRPQYWPEFESAQFEYVDHDGKEFTVLSVVLELMATCGFAVMFLETGDSLWPLECYVEVVPTTPLCEQHRVSEPA